jgi:hypothetical protein
LSDIYFPNYLIDFVVDVTEIISLPTPWREIDLPTWDSKVI